MVKYISIGGDCAIKYQINKRLTQSETLPFDWTVTSFDAVINLLNCSNIDDVLNQNSLLIKPYQPHMHVCFTKLGYYYSIHDLPYNATCEEISNFISMYKRRYKRLIDCINQAVTFDTKIYFLHSKYCVSPLTIDEYEIFDQAIKNINPNCIYELISIYTCDDNHKDIKVYSNFTTIPINMLYPLENTALQYWTRNHFDWDLVFDYITQDK